MVIGAVMSIKTMAEDFVRSLSTIESFNVHLRKYDQRLSMPAVPIPRTDNTAYLSSMKDATAKVTVLNFDDHLLMVVMISKQQDVTKA